MGTLNIELTQKGKLLRLQWLPSHFGLQGNERADILAKYGAKDGTEIDFIPDYMELIQNYKNICYDQWKEYFNQRSRDKRIWYKTIQCQPTHIPWCMLTNLSRRLVVIGHRLRSGYVTCNKFSYLMKKTSSPNCVTCGVIEDLQHLLVECVRYESTTNNYIQTINVNKHDVGIFHKVLSQPTSKEAKSLFKIMYS